MAKSRKTHQEQASHTSDTAHDSTSTPTPEQTIAPDAAEAASTTAKITLAEAKLARMQEVNRICFRHQNDFQAIEDELRTRLELNQTELDHVMEPKGIRNIPGFGYSEIARQRQYIQYLKQSAVKRDTHTDQLETRREDDAQGQTP